MPMSKLTLFPLSLGSYPIFSFTLLPGSFFPGTIGLLFLREVFSNDKYDSP